MEVQEGTVKPHPNFNAEADAETLRKAMKGLGTDEDALTSVLAARSSSQRLEIVKTFKTMFGKDLISELSSELSSHYRSVCTGLCLSPPDFDATIIKKAIKGAGTDEAALIEILCTRTNHEIHALNESYKRLYHKKLEQDLIDDTSGHFKRLLVSLVQGNRDESVEIDQAKVSNDASQLYAAGEKKLGTDESKFNAILVARSYAHLRAVFAAYRSTTGKDIEDSIKSEMSGDLEDGMLTIVRSVKDRPSLFAKVLYKSMKGAGTKDERLLRVIVSRCEIDMVQIKQAFQRDYKQSLADFISVSISYSCCIKLKYI
ncbi:hypothetical protein EB796_020664 [Bugula neritina]|uniref:Annexin n=1 Tax=Bugula neritina TaxID=10212 RepID=A0A7J7J578_BUGNE|nr:hypothetical protein EB796_020664 [Bugula neritina]